MKAIHVSGKRKKAIARATLKEGKGIIRINKQLLEVYQPEMCRMKVMEPLLLAGDFSKKVNINIEVNGGGQVAQAEAARLTIGKSLAKYNNGLKKVFLDYDRGLLVADKRRNEPSKPNDSKPRAARQKSYR